MVQHVMKTQSTHVQNETSESQAQMLSALIDGELSDEQASLAIKQLSRNDALHVQYADYIAIGDAMRGLSAQSSHFTHNVMAALAQQPVVLAPTPASGFANTRKPTNRRPALWLAAATVTAISWSLWQSEPSDPATAAMAHYTHTESSMNQPASLHAAQPDASHPDASQPYLAAHQDFAQAVISTSEMRFSNASLEVWHGAGHGVKQ